MPYHNSDWIRVLPLQFEPMDTESRLQEGISLHQAGKLQQAELIYQQILQVNPENAEVLNLLGLIAYQVGKYDLAINLINQAIEIDNGQPAFFSNLGYMLQGQKKLEEAIRIYQEAIELNPADSKIHKNLGDALKEQGELQQAITAYNKAIEFNPHNAETYNNLGTVLQNKGDLESATVAYCKALEIDPNDQRAHLNLGMLHLLQGDFKNGWEQYQWRWKYEKFPSEYREFPQSFWAGENLSRKTILVWGEQGIGDEIMFASMLDDLRQMNANIIIECEHRLVSLFQRSFPDIRFCCRKNPPDQQLLNPRIDYQIPMGSLGQWLRTELDSFKKSQSYYLAACPKKVSELRHKYQQLANNKKLVGISWKSTGINKRHASSKSIPLKNWLPILSHSNYYFTNLQYGDVESELAQFESETNLEVYRDQEIDPLAHLDDFAAQISALDLIISIDNSTVHMAGALGKKVWTLLPYMPDWRWLLDKEDAIWYSTMKLFRQNKIGDWQDTFQQLRSMMIANI